MMKKANILLIVFTLSITKFSFAGTGGADDIGIIFLVLIGLLLMIAFVNYSGRIFSFVKTIVILGFNSVKRLLQKYEDESKPMEISIPEI